MEVSFHDLSVFQGWELFPDYIQGLIRNSGATSVCEVGAGANPALSEAFVKANGIAYTLLDSEEAELSKALYRPASMVCDICEPEVVPAEVFDLVFSRMTFEHCRDSATAHRNIRRMLKPGGWAVHSFATLFALPFLVNRSMPEWLTRLLLDTFHRRDHHQHDKFPARYDLCRGPVASQISALENLGYVICEYQGYFGHKYYSGGLRILGYLEELKTRALLRKPIPLLTTYATVVMRKQ